MHQLNIVLDDEVIETEFTIITADVLVADNGEIEPEPLLQTSRVTLIILGLLGLAVLGGGIIFIFGKRKKQDREDK